MNTLRSDGGRASSSAKNASNSWRNVLRGDADIVAIELDPEIAKALVTQQLHGAQDDMDALGIMELPEETETVLGSFRGGRQDGGGLIELAVPNLE